MGSTFSSSEKGYNKECVILGASIASVSLPGWHASKNSRAFDKKDIILCYFCLIFTCGIESKLL